MPPENAVVLCVDEKSQIKAFERTAPLLPMRMGDAEKRTHDYHRRGTSTLVAALQVATGQVTGAVKSRHRRHEFLSFCVRPDLHKWMRFSGFPNISTLVRRLLVSGLGN